MAFTVTHRAEFTDLLGVDWRVDILKDQAQAAIGVLQATGDPLHIEWLTPGDDLLFNPIKGSIVMLNIECTTNFQYIDLYSSENMVYKMKIYYASTLYWQGWVSSDYTEPYDTPPYTVSIVAADGLGMLKNIAYDNVGVAYTGRDEEDDILLDIFAKIGYTTFTEYCNIYEDRMADAVTDSPFVQCVIDNDLFQGMDCYTVLDAILKPYNAVIRQLSGEFVIYRPVELVEDDLYGRIITAGAVTGTHIHPDQFLQRPVLSPTSDLADVNGGVMMMQPPIKQFTAEQDYGNRESWLKNYKFNADTYDNSTYSFDNWIRVGTAGIQRPVSFVLIKKETEGIAFLPTVNTPPDLTSYVYQIFGNYAKLTNNDIILEFEYRLINLTGSDVTNLNIDFIITDGTYEWYLNELDENSLEWVNAYRFVAIIEATVPKGQGEWISYSRSIPGLPIDGPFIMELFQADQDIYLCYRNIKFSTTSDAVVIRTKKVSRWKPWVLLTPLAIVRFFGGGYKKVKDTFITDNEDVVSKTYNTPDPATIQGNLVEQQYILGDCEDTGVTNVIEQFMGSLAVSTTGSLTQTATNFVIANDADYATGGVLLTSNSNDIVFTSDTAGTNFTGNTTIINATGDLSGSVTATSANQTAIAQVAAITLTGTSGSAKISTMYSSKVATFDSDLNTTASNFVTDNEVYFAANNITLSFSVNDIIFTETVALGGFGSIAIGNLTSNLNGTLDAGKQTAAQDAVARIDTITLTGTSGTANILCDGKTHTATFDTGVSLDYTTSWHTRGNTEAQPIIELIADEIATLYNKGRQFIQLPMEELEGNPTNFIPTYNLQDPINVTGVDYKLFATNRAALDVRNRTWTADIIEIGVKAP